MPVVQQISRGGGGVKEKPDSIIMSIKLRSGLFEGSIEIPLDSTKEERDRFIDSWLTMLQAGIKCGETKREAAE